MPKATTLKAAVAAVMAASMDAAQQLHRDRDWLWLVGDYRDEPELRETLRETGFRFSGRGHELDTGETAHWYYAEGMALGRGRRRKAKAKRAATKAINPEPKPKADADLFCKDPDAEFEAMFG